ncbi:hypothetical protein C8J56DRAFT_1043125 [Mycena floridula]|nr:hypothetical protein C8J56DRAFT_1043125 [Mycena floridula]
MKLFKKKSSRDVRRLVEDEAQRPPLPSSPPSELRRGMSLPILMISPTSLADDVNQTIISPPAAVDTSKELLTVASAKGLKSLPPTPVSPSSPTEMMWKGISDAQADNNISKTEKMVNKASDIVGGAMNTVQSTNGVVGLVKTVMANEEVKVIGKAILDGIPAIMSTLETLTEVHPFLKAAYLPFKLIYGQEMKRRENDQKRRTLFEKIKDVMFVLLELKEVKKDDPRITPQGEPLLSRLEQICKDMKSDIEECYNVLNAQEKRGIAVKFLHASAWNGQLASYAVKFESRRGELKFALQMRIATGVDEINANVKEMREMFMQMFATYRTPQEREIGTWIERNGGEKAVLDDKDKCLQMLKKESSMSQGSSHHMQTRSVAVVDDDTAITNLRKEYRQDIKVLIQDNMEGYMKRFTMGIEQLNEDLTAKIAHQGDRIINALSGGPHKRIKDKIMYHVWKEQGWKGSAKTRPLVLAIKDYLVERVERSNTHKDASKPPPSPIHGYDEDPDDPEMVMGEPLPDDWIIEYLQVKNLRYLQQALDSDGSGFTTISEVNAFTRARPEDWSLPRWISFWTIGWQISATKYAEEIEDIFNQMILLRREIGLKMPVSGVTRSIERHDNASSWLTAKYEDFVKSQENTLRTRLETISYDVDALETVHLIIGQQNIETVIFPLLTLILRHHLAKFHLCLQVDISEQELTDDSDTVTWVLQVLYNRYLSLTDLFKTQQTVDLEANFEWFSFGIFKNYFAWKEWESAKYFRDNDPSVWVPTDTVRDLESLPLLSILLHEETPDTFKTDDRNNLLNEHESEETSEVQTPEAMMPGTWYGFEWTESTKPYTPMLRLEFKVLIPETVKSDSTSELVTDIKRHSLMYQATPSVETNGAQVDASPTSGVAESKGSDTESSSDDDALPEKSVSLAGSSRSYTGQPCTLSGTVTLPLTVDPLQDSFPVHFERTYEDGYSVIYTGNLSISQRMLSGTMVRGSEEKEGEGTFVFKKTDSPAILCHRPLKVKPGPKELWSFACQSVLNQIRRHHFTANYVCERLADIRHLLELAYKKRCDIITDEEKPTLAALTKTFTFSEYSAVWQVSDWYSRVGDLQPEFTCDSCSSTIMRSRIVCLDCEVDPDTGATDVNFCGKAECIDAVSAESRSEVTHSVDHLRVKLRDLLLIKDYYDVNAQARRSVECAEYIYAPPPSDTVEETESPTTESSVDAGTDPTDEEEPKENTLQCLVCHTRVTSPCWYCIDCDSNDAFVCDSCEFACDELYPWRFQERYRKETEEQSAHNVFHILYRFRAKPDEESGEGSEDQEEDSPGTSWDNPAMWKKMGELVDERIHGLQDRVDKRMEVMDNRLTDMEDRLATGFGRLEALLTTLLQKKDGIL